jgi:hypothetical protein
MAPEVTFKIGLVGPTRIGKTSLITALLAESRTLLAGSGVTMHTVGVATEAKIASNRKELDGDLLAGEFQSKSLKGTVEPFTFHLKLDPGVSGSEINIDLLDFPGGWLVADERPAQYAQDWDQCLTFIKESTVLLVPVDAALLMEASLAKQRHALPRLLTTYEVEEVARDWAIERNRKPYEPALVVFCPVKCESYFADNGGRRDRSVQLLQRFKETYAEVITAINSEAPKASLIYAPIDTIGCVELIDATWPLAEGSQDHAFHADYRVRRPAKISRKGVDDVMRALCKHLVDSKRVVSAAEGQVLSSQADQAWRYAERREGFFRDLWFLLNGERLSRQRDAEAASEKSQEAWERVAALEAVLNKIASAQYGQRVHEL